MSEDSALRALSPLRLLMFAAVLGFCWVVAGAMPASADEGPAGRPLLSGSAPATTAISGQIPIAPRPVASVAALVVAVVKPVVVLKPVAAVLAPVTPVIDAVPSPLPVLDQVTDGARRIKAPPSRSHVVHLTPTSKAVVPQPSVTHPKPAGADLSSEAQPESSGLLDASGPFPSAPPNPVTAPLSSPSSVTTGAAGAGSGGHGSALAHISDGGNSASALLLANMLEDPWVLAESLANDPGSSPD